MNESKLYDARRALNELAGELLTLRNENERLKNDIQIHKDKEQKCTKCALGCVWIKHDEKENENNDFMTLLLKNKNENINEG